MGQNSNRYERFRQTRCQNLRHLRTRVRRSHRGKILGVFKGISESMGWPCGITRWVGIFLLFSLAGMVGVHGGAGYVLGAGFFYLLASLLMGPPRPELESAAPSSASGTDWRSGVREASAAASGLYGSSYRPRVDLASLDRQLHSLNRRIRRMESVVTDPAYDWERRLGK